MTTANASLHELVSILAAEYDAACADLRAAHQGADDGALLAAMRRYHAARFALGQRCICDVRAEDPDVRHRLGCSTQGRPVVTVREVPRG